MQSSATHLKTYPEGVESLPLDAALRKQFQRQGNFNVKMPLLLMRGLVHLATLGFSYSLYHEKLNTASEKIKLADRSIGLRMVRTNNTDTSPVVLYFHGGGGLLADSSSYSRVLNNLACATGAVVIGVDYNRAPEWKFPTALMDGWETIRWIQKQATRLHLDPDRIILAGDSAGGNLVAGLSLYVRDHNGPHILQQILINPRTNHQASTKSLEKFGDGYGLSESAIRFFEQQNFKVEQDALNGYASPLRNQNLGGLPDTVIVTSEYDPLRDEGEDFGFRLRQAGVSVDIIRYLGMAHTMVAFGATREAAEHFYRYVGRKITGALNSGSRGIIDK